MSRTEMFNFKYQDEVWTPLALHPDAWSTTRFDDTARLLRNEKGRFLDVGCGGGQFIFAMAEQFESLVGIDLSNVRIASANRALEEFHPQYRDKIRFICGEADARLPLEDSSVDVVVATVVLEFVANVFTLMDEFARVCRPGGCVVITVANVCYIKHVFSLLAGKVPLTSSGTRSMEYWRQHGWDGGCLRYFSQSTRSALLDHTGFSPEEWTGSGALSKLRRWHANLCGSIPVRARRR